MKQNQSIVQARVVQEDKSAYRLAREEGKSPYDFVKMTVVMMASIGAVVMIGSKFDKLMHDPLIGLIGTGIIVLVLVRLFQGFEKNYG